MNSASVSFSIADHIAQITLNRPPVNAFSLGFLDEILNALRNAANDRRVRAVIVDSALERVFCAGLDLELLTDKPILEIRAFLENLYTELWDIQYHMGKPTIAAIAGAARGGGMTLAISCDVIIASEAASFGYPEIDLGLLPAIHFTHLPRIIGRYRAFELLFSGRTFDATEAMAIGLVNRIAPGAELHNQAHQLAATFAKKSPTAMRLGRAAFMRANDLDYRRGVASAVDDFCNAVLTPDAQEGLNAFNAKRSPRWPADTDPD